MKFKVTLQDTRNNFEKEYQDDYDWQDSNEQSAFNNFEYQWTEGNFGCDCNRIKFLYGEFDNDRQCTSDTIRITKIVDEAGEEYPIDNFNENC